MVQAVRRSPPIDGSPEFVSQLLHVGFGGPNGKGKGIPVTGHEGPRGMWMQGSTYSQPRH